jgi:hypothetical protein
MTSELPQRLAYLGTVMAELSKIEPEELGDDNPDAMDLVMPAIRSRLHGLEEDEARDLLREDCDLLGEWMNQPGAGTSPAGYIHGALLGTLMWGDFGDLVKT